MQGFKTQFSQFPRFSQANQGFPSNPMPPSSGSSKGPEEAQEPPQRPVPQQSPQQSPPPPQRPPMPSPATPSPSKNPIGKIVLLTVIGLVLVSLIVSAGLLMTRIWDPLWSPFRPKPEVVLSQMTLKMVSLDSSHIKNKIEANIRGEKDVRFIFETEGDFSFKNTLKPQMESNFKVSSTVSEFKKGKESSSISGQLKAIGDDYYLRVDDLLINMPEIQEEFEKYQPLIEEIKGEWAKISKEDIDSFSQDNGQEALSEKELEELNNKIKQIIISSGMLVIKEQMADEKIGDIDFYHYVVSLDKEKTKKAIDQIIRAVVLAKKEEDPRANYLNFIQPFFENALDEIEEITAELWIGKEDLYLYKLEAGQNIGSGGLLSGNISVEISLDFSQHNKPINIEVPAGSKNVEEIYGPIINKIEVEQKNSKIKTDIMGIVIMAENMFDEQESYLGLDCINQLVEPFCEDIKNITGDSPAIYRSNTRFCVYSSLVKEKDTDERWYYCADNTMILGTGDAEWTFSKTNVDPSSAGYCNGRTLVCPNIILEPSPTPDPSLQLDEPQS